MVVMPTISTSGELNAAKIASASSAYLTKSKVSLAIHQRKNQAIVGLAARQNNLHDATQTMVAFIPTYSGICVDDQLFAWHVSGGCCCGATASGSTWVLTICLSHHRILKYAGQHLQPKDR